MFAYFQDARREPAFNLYRKAHPDSFAGLGLAPILIGATYFFLWGAQLFAGGPDVPKRSRVGLMVLTVLTIGAFVVEWDYGLKYHGRVPSLSLCRRS